MCDYLGEQIVFLISQPRSGSTLLQFILNSHPEIHTTPEPWLMLHPLYALRKKGLKAEYNAAWASTHVEEFLNHIKDQEEAYFLAIRKAFSYLYSKALEGSGKNMFLDKTPRYYYIIPHLSKVFPSAKFIILLRNPLAVLASILTTWVKDIWQKLSLYRDDLLKAPRLLIEGIDLLGSHCSIVQYEHIVREPEKTIKNLCDGLNITFYPEMLKYAEKDRPRGDYGDPVSVWQHKRPMASYADAWIETYRSSKQWKSWGEEYLEALGPKTIKKMGYSFENLSQPFLSKRIGSKFALIPFDLAIKRSEKYTLADQMKVNTFKIHRYMETFIARYSSEMKNKTFKSL